MTDGRPFRFDAWAHEYVDAESGHPLPHITGMLKASGWVDDRWFTEESCERGTQAHRLTAEYDLGALDVDSCVSRYRGYLLAHVQAMQILRPDVLEVEQPDVHPDYQFGGRPDRVIRLNGLLAVLEGKTGVPTKAHPIQTALQAILKAPKYGLPAEAWGRFCLYWKDNGKFKLEEYRDPRDYVEAHRIIRACCHV